MNEHQFETLLSHIRALAQVREQVVVAIEGGSASGKSTLAQRLAEQMDCNVFHMDDFFLQPHQRTKERFLEPGGNVDRERFLSEVLLPLKGGAPFSYRVFDCGKMALGEWVQVTPKRVNIVEGAYCMHPLLREYYDFSVFMKIDPETQSHRILLRNGERWHKRFMNEWIPMEQKYFTELSVREHCTLVLEGE